MSNDNLTEIRPPYQPHVKQMMLHNAPISADDIMLVLFGGERGGGKSAAILMDAFFFCTTYPGSRAVIIRESLDAVKSSFLDKLGGLMPQTMNGQKIYEYREKGSSMIAPLSRSIIFENGSYITLQRVANLAEAEAKQGWEFNYLAIDELTKQTEETFNYLLSTVRSASRFNQHTGEMFTIPTKVVAGCNPGGIGHQWVKKRFITPTVTLYDEEKRTPLKTKDHIEYITVPSKEDPTKEDEIKITVRFIPASWRDNPFLNKAYVAMLMSQPEHRRKMDMEGNWDVVAGRKFNYQDDSFIDDHTARELIHKYKPDIYISIDWGYKPSYHSAHWEALFYDGSVIVFDEVYGQELIFEKFVEKIKAKSYGMDIVATCLPHDLYRGGDNYRDREGRQIGETKAEVFEHHGLNPIGVQSGKGTVLMRFDKIHSASELQATPKTKKFRISKKCTGLIDELENAMEKDDNSGHLDPHSLDHALDDYGLFLVMYSSDIAPLGLEDFKPVDKRGKWVKRMEDEEADLRKPHGEEFGVNSRYNIAVDSEGDLS